MIKAVLFDLDGTLVNTESLKSLAYFQAIQTVAPGVAGPGEVEKAYRVVVGRARQEVAAYMVDRFGLKPAAREKAKEMGVEHAWQTYPFGYSQLYPYGYSKLVVQLFAEIYNRMLADPELLGNCLCSHTVDLLRYVRQTGRLTALASMSSAGQVEQILALSGLDRQHRFDLVLTREQVSRPKPDPEIYLLAAQRLGQSPGDCLVIEDSTVGVQAGLAAGMRCVGLATPLTAESLHAFAGLPPEWIVDDPQELVEIVGRLLELKGDNGQAYE